MVTEIDLNKLASFLVKAKKATYAGNGPLVESQRPGFKELDFREGAFYYRDGYTGYFQGIGMEVVYFMEKLGQCLTVEE